MDDNRPASSIVAAVAVQSDLARPWAADDRAVHRRRIVLVLAAACNPIDFHYVAISGVGGSFGLTWGLPGIPGAVGSQSGGRSDETKPLGFEPAWVTVAIVVAILLVGVLGEGVRLSP